MSSPVRYLVFDVESIPRMPLIRGLTPEMPADATDQQVYDRYVEKKNAKSNQKPNDIPAPSHSMPLTIAWLKVNDMFAISEFGVYDAPNYRAKEATELFWKDVIPLLGMPSKMPYGHEHLCGLVTFNGKQWDMPVLEAQALADGLVLPEWFTRNVQSYLQPRNRYYRNHYDLNALYGNSGDHFPSLNALAKNIGLPGKMGTDGSQVWSMYQQGKLREIADYCLGDVLDTYWLFVRFAVQSGWLELTTETKYRQLFMDYLGRHKNPGVRAYVAKMREIAGLVIAP